MHRILLHTFSVSVSALFLVGSGLSACESVPSHPTEPRTLLTPATVDTNLTRIVIEKSKYHLHLYERDRLLRTYPIVLGSDPGPDKRMEGDGRTPEGKFHVRTKYPHASWDKFIWADYPTQESYRRFERRKAAGEIPKTATIGGEIGIHGVPQGRDHLISDRKNWTLGCISLTRADVEELYSLVRTGTEIQILH